MPKRTDISSILIIGAGPIVIGQACEFDYSGVQACKALRAEGYRIILVNSNPATIMTDPDVADATYVEPITPEMVEKIIAKERPDALLPTMGGQTALNTALSLFHSGVLTKYGVEMIGAKADVIEKAEDRQKFRDAMDHLGLESPKSHAAHTMEEALAGLDRAIALRPGTIGRLHAWRAPEFGHAQAAVVGERNLPAGQGGGAGLEFGIGGESGAGFLGLGQAEVAGRTESPGIGTQQIGDLADLAFVVAGDHQGIAGKAARRGDGHGVRLRFQNGSACLKRFQASGI